MKRFFCSFILCFSLGIMFSACSHLTIDYEFNPGETFTDIQGTFSEKSSTAYKGYMYYFHRKPDKPSLPWNNAELHSPANINGNNDVLQCWNQVDGNERTLNFYCGGSATTPATPPAGTYQVNVPPKTFTFNGVTSKTIDANLNNIYIPVIKLTIDVSGKISQIDWQWWKKTITGWVQPSDSELASNLKDAGFSIGKTNWEGDPATSRVGGDINLTTNGNIAPPVQSFTPGSLRINYSDKDNYHFGFEWR